MIVANIEDEGLLGHDLLMEGDAEILYKAGAIQFMGVQIPFKQVEGPSKVRQKGQLIILAYPQTAR